MKKFIIENWFKLGLLVVLFIAASGGAYYFGVFLPQEKLLQTARQQKDQLFSKNIECNRYDKQVNERETGFLGMKVKSGVFYSPKSNSCLYVGLDWDDKLKIRDATNEQDIFTEELKNMKRGTVGEEIKALVEQYSIN
jgi:hypothetical protein